MYDAIDIANYFIDLSLSKDKVINNLKLQKMLYYAYSFYKEGQLFDDSIEKWRLGPVTPNVYHIFKENGSSRITGTVTKLDIKKLEFVKFDDIKRGMEENKKVITFLNSIYNLLIDENVFNIVDKTHEEPMWKDQEEKINTGVTHLKYTEDEILEYFKNIKPEEYLRF